MASILILSSSELHKDPRVLRQIRALRDRHELYCCGLTESKMEGIVREYPILFRPSKNQRFGQRVKNYLAMKFGFYDRLTWDSNVVIALDSRPYDVIIVNDPREMPLAAALQARKSTAAKIYFDLHEYYVELDKDEIVNKMFRSLTDRYQDNADVLSTVSNEIATLYAERYNRDVQVITNAGRYYDYVPTEIGQKIRMVHHGVVNRSRQLERMIEIMTLVDDRYTLDFYLVGTDTKYLNELKELAKPLASIKFCKPVAYDDIVPTLSQYDLGLFLLPADVLSYKYALPNKLFEFIQARLAVAVSPNISMKNMVEKYKVGVVGKDYTAQSLAAALTKLQVGDLEAMKRSTTDVARKENEEEGIKMINRIARKMITA